jgi:membrane-bound metal-dependent hydrolase YbcI (DUF457 family)
MPFTPYHLGPSGLVGLVFKKSLDLPVFILANIFVDIEVLIFHNYPVHRYEHTLLIGAAVGAAWALAAFSLRNVFKKAMRLLQLPYHTTLPKMLISGILGVWLHVLIDGLYHSDVYLFWPSRKISLWRMAAKRIGYRQMDSLEAGIKIACLLMLIAAAALYILVLRRQKNKTAP